MTTGIYSFSMKSRVMLPSTGESFSSSWPRHAEAEESVKPRREELSENKARRHDRPGHKRIERRDRCYNRVEYKEEHRDRHGGHEPPGYLIDFLAMLVVQSGLSPFCCYS